MEIQSITNSIGNSEKLLPKNKESRLKRCAIEPTDLSHTVQKYRPSKMAPLSNLESINALTYDWEIGLGVLYQRRSDT